MNEYCDKHEWPAGMEKPCPDCAELAQLRALNEQYLGQIREQAKTIVDQAQLQTDFIACCQQLKDANLQNDVLKKNNAILDEALQNTLQEEGYAKSQVTEMVIALHLAYDWMGRQPKSEYDKAHFKSAAEKVEITLKNAAVMRASEKPIDEPRYCVKCGVRQKLGDAAHAFICTGTKGDAANPAPFIEEVVCEQCGCPHPPPVCRSGIDVLRDDLKRSEQSPMICNSCGWNNDANHGGGSRVMRQMGKFTICEPCMPTSR